MYEVYNICGQKFKADITQASAVVYAPDGNKGDWIQTRWQTGHVHGSYKAYKIAMLLMGIRVYTFEQKDGTKPEFTTQDPNEAKKYAQDNGLKMIANDYEFSDSELVEDYT